MSGLGEVIGAAVAFVGTHVLLSHPLRRPTVAAVGERGFMVLYALVALVTFAWLALAYQTSPAMPPLWAVGDGIWAVATVVMLVASVLMMGSFVGNPALPNAGSPPAEARGVYAVTRHPMMWAFALWGASHIAVYPMPANIVLAIGIIVLALVGAALQDAKKAALQPATWPLWQARTGFWPFAAIIAGRARFGGFGMHALAGGVVVWLAATWAHIPIAAMPAGIWRWL